MIIHKKVKAWLDRFKPGIKWKYKHGSRIFTVHDSKFAVRDNVDQKKSFSIKVGPGSYDYYIVWSPSRDWNHIEILNDDNT